ncbi:MAG: hypothetical protein NTW28_18155 [Candidatus Solibacter sp.]|nr:hypothetical protein [Candidatus Solibacter sp.]
MRFADFHSGPIYDMALGPGGTLLGAIQSLAWLQVIAYCRQRPGAGDEVIMSIAGHVSRAMLSRYFHVRMEAKRRALDEIAARQCAAEKRQVEAERRQEVAVASQAGVAVQ